MKKRMKKLASLLLASAMVFSPRFRHFNELEEPETL